MFHTVKDFSWRYGCFCGKAGLGVGSDVLFDDSKPFERHDIFFFLRILKKSFHFDKAIDDCIPTTATSY
ncbi:MAG: hypothetical protein ABSF10_01030 [Verrucomicrobiota bacterium]